MPIQADALMTIDAVSKDATNTDKAEAKDELKSFECKKCASDNLRVTELLRIVYQDSEVPYSVKRWRIECIDCDYYWYDRDFKQLDAQT